MTALAGFVPIFGVVARDEARRLVPWTLLLVLLPVSSVVAYDMVYPDPASRAELALVVSLNPAMNLIFGVPRDLTTTDGFNAWRAGGLGALLVGVMAIGVVVRNTRADEDSGRAELLASAVTGRSTRLAVAVVAAVTASVVAATISGVATVLAGGGVGATGLLCANFVASGLLFAAVAAVTAQVGADARTASTLATVVLGALYLARGYVDASDLPGWFGWTTPFGWLGLTLGEGRLGLPVVLVVLLAGVLVVLGFALQSRRDFGHGLLAPRPGPARGGWTRTLGGFQLRLVAVTSIAWLGMFVALGLVFGTLATSIGAVVTDNPVVARVIAAGAATESDLMFEFVRTMLKVLALIAACAGAQVVMALHAEEVAGRVEPLLATAIRRPHLLGWTAVVAFGTATVCLLVSGSLIGVLAARVDEEIGTLDVIVQTGVALPATWLMVAVGLAAVGARPQVRLLGWAVIAMSFVLTILGPLFELDTRILGISPLWHVPNVTALDRDWLGWWIVVGLWAVFTVVGFLGYRRRDIG